MIKKTTIIKFILSIFILSILVYYFSKLETEFTKISLKLINLTVIDSFLILLILFLLLFLWSARYKFILDLLKVKLSLYKSFILNLLGIFWSNIIPFKVGEVGKVIILKREYNVPLRIGTVSVIIERAYDLFTLVFFFVLFFNIGIVSNQYSTIGTIHWINIIIATIMLLSFFILCCLTSNHKALVLLSNLRIYNFLQEKVPFINKLNLQKEIFKRQKKSRTIGAHAYLLSLSFLDFLIETLIFLYIFKLAGINIGIAPLLYVVSISTIIGLLSQLPGGIISTELSSIILLAQLGIPEPIVITVVLINRLLTYYLIITLGGIANLTKLFKWKQINNLKMKDPYKEKYPGFSKDYKLYKKEYDYIWGNADEEKENFALKFDELSRTKKLLKILEKNDNKGFLLDIGPGLGRYHPHIKHRKIIALDISEVALRKLNNKHCFKKVCGNAEDMPFGDESISQVICLDALEHMINPINTLKEIYRVSKKGSQIIISLPIENKIRGFLRNLLGWSAENPYHLTDWSFKEAKETFGSFFEIEKVVRNPTIFPLDNFWCLRKK